MLKWANQYIHNKIFSQQNRTTDVAQARQMLQVTNKGNMTETKVNDADKSEKSDKSENSSPLLSHKVKKYRRAEHLSLKTEINTFLHFYFLNWTFQS